MATELRQGEIQTLDLHFQGQPGTIASYLIPHRGGAVLVESGPGSTVPTLQRVLKEHGLTVKDVTDVLLTHIHLDHAGAAGWLAQQGARIHVHNVGAPHMADPEKLLSSARRIYGDRMDTLWGDFLPVPEDRMNILHDRDVIEVEDLRFEALDTPGHANHHMAYLFDDTCFSGDIGGVRLSGTTHIRLPMPPPEFHLEKWRDSVARLKEAHIAGRFSRIAPTHFGIFSDPASHLADLEKAIEEVEAWMTGVMPDDPPIEMLNDQFLIWTRERSEQQGLDREMIDLYETANPSWMSPYGIQRYWRKYRNGADG